MKLENEFRVPASPERVWDFMLDVERVAPCMPGAEITEQVDDHTWKGKVGIKLGPVSLSFAGTLVREETDATARRVVLKGKGTETRGKGMAAATVTSRLEEADGGTKVLIETDLQISGAAAQYGRGMIADVSRRFTQEFADCLAAEIGEAGGNGDASAEGGAETQGASKASAAGPSVEGAAAPAPGPGATRPRRKAKPVGGIRLTVWALSRAFGRFLRRLFGGGAASG